MDTVNKNIFCKQYDLFLNITLLLLLLFLTVKMNCIPAHDTFWQYQSFFVFYNHFYFYKTILQWFPYGSYGIPAMPFNLMSITPALYLITFVGKVLDVTNTLLLFEMGIYIEIFIYFIGLYFLLIELNVSKSIRFIVLLSALSTTALQWQIGFMLNIFYLIPLILFCFIRLDKTKQIRWLYYSGYIFLINIIGIATYLILIQFYTLFFFFIGLLITNRALSKTVFSTAIFKTKYFALLIIMLIPFITMAHFITHDLIDLTPGRIHGYNTVDTFIHYAFQPIGNVVYGYLTGNISLSDNTYYIGLFLLAAFIYGIFYCDNKYFRAFLLPIIFLIWLSISGIFAHIVYFFPGMKYYRHIDLTFGITSCLMIISAAIIIQNIVNDHTRRFVCPTFFIIIFTLMIVDFLVSHFVLHTIPTFHSTVPIKILTTKFNLYQLFFCMRIIFYSTFIFFAARSQRPIWIILFSIAIFDVMSYQFLQLYDIKHNYFTATKTITTAEKIKYQPKRSDTVKNMTPNQLERWNLSTNMASVKNSLDDNSAVYSQSTYLFASSDPCHPKYRVDLLSPSIAPLFQQINHGHGTNNLLNIIGCHSSKLFLNGLPLFTFQLNHFSGDTVSFTVENKSDRSQLLTYADAQYPGWTVFIDGQQKKLMTTQHGFKAVVLSPGVHTVYFEYANLLYLILSWFLAGASLLFFLSLIMSLSVFLSKLIRSAT